MPAANGISQECRCRLQMASARSADVGCKSHEPGMEMLAANGLTREYRTTDAGCKWHKLGVHM